jgi:hypothetical protein
MDKELLKYINAKALAMPKLKSDLTDSDMVFVAHCLFGAKFAELSLDKQIAKARLVIGGHLGFNKKGKVIFSGKSSDKEDFWAPTAPLSALRMCAAHSALNRYTISSVDLSQAYLQSLLGNSHVYIQLPDNIFKWLPTEFQEAIKKLNVSPDQIVFQAISALYGIDRAGFDYMNALHQWLMGQGWIPMDRDKASFHKIIGGHPFILITYVDDLTLVGPEELHEQTWKEILSDRWKADPAAYVTTKNSIRYLGIVVSLDEHGAVILDQEEYAQSIIEEYERRAQTTIRSRKTLPTFAYETYKPMLFTRDDGKTLHSPDPPTLPDSHPDIMAHAARNGKENNTPQGIAHSVIGMLMYMSRGTRVDCALVVQRLAERIHDWQDDDTVLLEAILGYLKGVKCRLAYPRPTAPFLCAPRMVAFTDSNYLAPISRSGYLLCLCWSTRNEHGCYILDWSSKKQKYAALSTGQAECTALTTAVRQAEDAFPDACIMIPKKWQSDFKKYYAVYCDATATIAGVRRGWSRALSHASRVIGCSVTWLHQKAIEGTLRLAKIDGTKNPSDALTKPVPGSATSCLYDFLSVKIGDEPWTQPNHGRADSTIDFPFAVQMIHDGKTQVCTVCKTEVWICYRCKICDVCGCECTDKNEKSHPLASHLPDIKN